MALIKVLPDNIANQIAAGEVIVRPASCVKELVENSIDAGARNITVRVEDAGKKLIEVKDDGCGMAEEDAKTAFLRHATSKIREAKDLFNVTTMGFRGEALAAISSVARVEIITKREEDEMATRLLLEKSSVIKEEKTASNTGTLIRVKDLFYNTPARLKFMKSNHTEESHITDAVISAALSGIEIGFTLFVSGNPVIEIKNGLTLKERITEIYGRETSSALVEISAFTDSVKVHGYCVKPNLARNVRGHQHLFVNNRPVTSRALNYAVVEGYGTLLMKGMYPVTFIYIQLNPASVDVNVHPAKAEVKFKDERFIYNLIKKAVSEAFGAAELSVNAVGIKNEAEGYKESIKNAVSTYMNNEQEALFTPDTSAVRHTQTAAPVMSQKRNFLWMRVLGQINKTYIVGEDSGALVLIDQHAAHEKSLYEKMLKQATEKNMRVQEMLIPEIIEIPANEVPLFEENIPLLENLGFTADLFGPRQIRITSAPVLLRGRAAAPLVREILGLISEKGGANKEEALKAIISMMACRAAVKAGDELSEQEIDGLLNDYFESDAPYSCPHGRPAIIKISFEELEKMFKRKL